MHPLSHIRDQRGVTLIELLVAVSIFVVLAVSSATLFSLATKVNTQNKLVQEIQREGDAVMASMASNLREAVSVDTANSNFSSNPNSIQVRLANNQTRRYYVSGNQLRYVNESGTDEVLVQPGTTVSSLTFSPAADAAGLQVITMQMGLSRSKGGYTQTLTFGSTINTRPQ